MDHHSQVMWRQSIQFRALLPATTKVKCISDAGFFIHAKDVSGGQHIENFYGQVAKLHGSVKNLPASCTSRMGMRPELCFFSQYVVQTMQTPIFFINAAYDSLQIKNILAPSAADSDFRAQILSALTGAGSSSSRGIFIDSCYAHCQAGNQITWSSNNSPAVGNTKIAKAVGDWYYERSPVQEIDCPYPCNPNCQNTDSESQLPDI
ncbi:hypothetical protein CRYUN_Cryun12cG0001700 [Craigia yunnanensis]